MDKLLKDYAVQLVEHGCAPGAGRWGALVTVDDDISAVFPYLNAVLPNAKYDHENHVLIWQDQGQWYAFRPNEIRIANVEGLEQAQKIVADLVDRVNRIWLERNSITPRFTERKLASIIDIFKLLPGTNCKQCGYPTCMAFAADLRKHAVQAEACLPLVTAGVRGKKRKFN